MTTTKSNLLMKLFSSAQSYYRAEQLLDEDDASDYLHTMQNMERLTSELFHKDIVERIKNYAYQGVPEWGDSQYWERQCRNYIKEVTEE